MPTEILSHLPKAELFERLEPRFRDLFRTANSLLDTYHKSYERLLQPPPEQFIDHLLTQARDYHASALGYLLDQQYAESVGNERLAYKSMKLAQNREQLALILADAADRANMFTGSPQNPKVESIVAFIQTRVVENPAYPEAVGDILSVFRGQRERGFQIPPPHTRLATVICDEGCPDTADVMRITTAYRIPVDILIMNERHKDRHGFRQSNDHAIALYEDMYGSPPIPCVIFPDGTHMSEPPLYQFVKALFENGMI